MNKSLVYSPPSKDCIPETSAFFETQIGKMQEFEYEASIVKYLVKHSVNGLLEKIEDPKRYFELIRDTERNNKIIGYFESRTQQDNEETQYIQWTFVDSDYVRQGLARTLFERFHAFCHTHGCRYAKSKVREVNTISRQMHETMWYEVESITDGFIIYVKHFPESTS